VAATPQKASAEALASTTAITLTSSLPSITEPMTGVTTTVLLALGTQHVSGVRTRDPVDSTTSADVVDSRTRTLPVGAWGITRWSPVPTAAS
jgi:hypothetical protein